MEPQLAALADLWADIVNTSKTPEYRRFEGEMFGKQFFLSGPKFLKGLDSYYASQAAVKRPNPQEGVGPAIQLMKDLDENPALENVAIGNYNGRGEEHNIILDANEAPSSAKLFKFKKHGADKPAGYGTIYKWKQGEELCTLYKSKKIGPIATDVTQDRSLYIMKGTTPMLWLSREYLHPALYHFWKNEDAKSENRLFGKDGKMKLNVHACLGKLKEYLLVSPYHGDATPGRDDDDPNPNNRAGRNNNRAGRTPDDDNNNNNNNNNAHQPLDVLHVHPHLVIQHLYEESDLTMFHDQKETMKGLSAAAASAALFEEQWEELEDALAKAKVEPKTIKISSLQLEACKLLMEASLSKILDATKRLGNTALVGMKNQTTPSFVLQFKECTMSGEEIDEVDGNVADAWENIIKQFYCVQPDYLEAPVAETFTIILNRGADDSPSAKLLLHVLLNDEKDKLLLDLMEILALQTISPPLESITFRPTGMGTEKMNCPLGRDHLRFVSTKCKCLVIFERFNFDNNHQSTLGKFATTELEFIRCDFGEDSALLSSSQLLAKKLTFKKCFRILKGLEAAIPTGRLGKCNIHLENFKSAMKKEYAGREEDAIALLRNIIEEARMGEEAGGTVYLDKELSDWARIDN